MLRQSSSGWRTLRDLLGQHQGWSSPPWPFGLHPCGPNTWALWTGAVVLSAITACLAWAKLGRLEAEFGLLDANMTASRPSDRFSKEPLRRDDFVHELPSQVQTSRVVEVLQRASREAGIQLSSVQVREPATAPSQLGRCEIGLSLKGPYAAVKQVLGEVLFRFPFITVRSLQWRLAEAGAPQQPTPMTEATVVLSLWTAPAGLIRSPRAAPSER